MAPTTVVATVSSWSPAFDTVTFPISSTKLFTLTLNCSKVLVSYVGLVGILFV